MSKKIAIHWFRQDLRIADNPALHAASQHYQILPIYINDTVNADDCENGAASKWWLHQSLLALDESLNGKLSTHSGNPSDILSALISQHNITAIFWNRCYEPWRISRDKQLKGHLNEQGITIKTFNGSLLWEPWEVLKKDQTPYKVFTPYYQRGCLSAKPPRLPLPAPKGLELVDNQISKRSINELGLLPKIPWDKKLGQHWYIGESAAQAKLQEFISGELESYKTGRDFPALQSVSRLSPHLHFGEVSPNQTWYAAKALADGENRTHFLRELGWREFSHSLLYHFPELPVKNLQTKFDRFPWLHNDQHLDQWQRGQTGHPLVDAGMRELWQTGYMHNRVRMVVGSFLVKNLLLDWHHGERWFWDCLVDADLANNSSGWQWVAGCGADAAPYFRVFNPMLQGQRFDPNGEYTRHFVPELKALPKKYLYNPWDAPTDILQEAGIELGVDYPKPIVDIKESRLQALAAYKALSQ